MGVGEFEMFAFGRRKGRGAGEKVAQLQAEIDMLRRTQQQHYREAWDALNRVRSVLIPFADPLLLSPAPNLPENTLAKEGETLAKALATTLKVLTAPKATKAV
jgi:hypothetical protein